MTDTLFDIDTTLDLDTIIEEEIEKMPPCEGETHPLGTNGHKVEQSAAFLVICPNGKFWNACQGWVDKPAQVVQCTRCGGKLHPAEKMTYIPLDIRME